MRSLLLCLVLLVAPLIYAHKIVLGNDDGWAVAVIREQFSALEDAEYDVVLSCPAVNQSGTGRLSTRVPFPLITPCEFNTCPAGSAVGSNASDPRLNYINAYPVDAMNYGIKLFKHAPDFAVAGPNVGNNLGGVVLFSGTVAAASAASLAGIPSASFSGSSDSLSQVSYTTLESDPTSANTVASNLYAQLTVKFVDALFSSSASGPILPTGISLNVNYPPIANCPTVSDYKFVLTRILPNLNPSATDVKTCGTSHLPVESDVAAMKGCFISVSVFNASTLLDVSASTQQKVLNKLGSLLTCLPSTY
ncbi:hypothetical protein GYMLUDRAFT_70895 [Collybiopsis luxurians FD-317 M1]|nr:hypothetical protein GYMLUDRAFT_70895 [Collybiopsis luxurians FD-317 M1]